MINQWMKITGDEGDDDDKGTTLNYDFKIYHIMPQYHHLTL
jgi:hypothetical protein